MADQMQVFHFLFAPYNVLFYVASAVLASAHGGVTKKSVPHENVIPQCSNTPA